MTFNGCALLPPRAWIWIDLHRQDGSDLFPCLTSRHPSFNYLVIQLWRRYVPYLHKTFCSFRFASHCIPRCCDTEWKEIAGHSYSIVRSGNNLCLACRVALLIVYAICCNVRTPFVFSTDCTGFVLIILTLNCDCFRRQYKMAGLRNRDALCSLWGTKQVVYSLLWFIFVHVYNENSNKHQHVH